MKPEYRFFLESFISIGFPFAVFMEIPEMWQGRQFDIIRFTFYLVGFGMTMAAFAVGVQITAIKSLGITEISYTSLGVKHELQVYTDLSLMEVYMLVTDKLNYTRTKIGASDKIIKLNKGISVYSFGERISIQQLNSLNGTNTYEIRSRPIILGQFMDNGLNLKNVLEIEDLLTTVE